ncbi:MAG: hypothetical protein JW837_05000, partial [Sedimentisphaerales bacterium]|nr:hypothetical protein [Sedimentisphaerales bacterium]
MLSKENTVHQWFDRSETCYQRSGNSPSNTQAITVEGEGTLTFWWKVDSEAGCDELQFIADGSKE